MSGARIWITIGAILAGLAVAAGAWAAHGLDPLLAKKYAAAPAREIAGLTVPAAWKYLQDFNTASRYQMYHALALILVGILSRQQPRRSLHIAGICFLLGIVFFSGSLYVLTLTGVTAWGAVTPIGGVLMIVGWGVLAWSACNRGPVS